LPAQESGGRVIPFAPDWQGFLEYAGYVSRRYLAVACELTCQQCGRQYQRVLLVPNTGVTLPDVIPFSSCIVCNEGKQTEFWPFDLYTHAGGPDPGTLTWRMKLEQARQLKADMGGYRIIKNSFVKQVRDDGELFTEANIEKLLDQTFPRDTRAARLNAERWRTVLNLYFRDGCFPEDIGAEFGLTRRSVEKIIFSARKKISKIGGKSVCLALQRERPFLDPLNDTATPATEAPCKNRNHKSAFDSVTKESRRCTFRTTVPTK
jgi:hypothetical protein